MPLAVVKIRKWWVDSLMAKEITTPTVISDPALEMIMRDVIDSMCEFSLESGFQPADGGFKIIEIYPANREDTDSYNKHRSESADMADSEIIEFPDLRRAAG